MASREDLLLGGLSSRGRTGQADPTGATRVGDLRSHEPGTQRGPEPGASRGGLRTLPLQECREDEDKRMVGAVLGEEERSWRLRDPGRHCGGGRVLLPWGRVLGRSLREILREGQLVSAAPSSSRNGGTKQCSAHGIYCYPLVDCSQYGGSTMTFLSDFGLTTREDTRKVGVV